MLIENKIIFIVLSILNQSLIYNKIPNNNVAHAIVSIFLIFSIKFVSTKITPTNITGSDDIIILKKFYLCRN